MKIIDNKKDYYDYLTGVYGLDDYVIYDRRDNNVISKQLTRFNKDIDVMDKDGVVKFKVTLWAGHNMKTKILKVFVDRNTGTKTFEWMSYEELIKMESKQAWFRYSRFDKKNDSQLPKKVTSSTPLVLYIEEINYYHDRNNYTVTNPILEGSIFTNILPAHEVYEGIYNFLLECKEPDIVDKRNDIEHIESHGFDKKTSFRNM